MILVDLLKALSGNTNVNVTLLDEDENTLITFNAAGYAAVESDLGIRTVKRVKIATAQAVSVMIEDPVEEKPEETEGDSNETENP